MPYKNLELIIFDWDGTLMDSVSVITDCITKAYHSVLKEDLDRNKAKSIIGLGLAGAMQTICPDATENELHELVVEYRRLFNEKSDEHLSLFTGARDLVTFLKGNSIKTAVATGKSRAGLERDLNRTDMNGIFDATRTVDESLPKPDPQMLIDITNELNISTDNAIMIGDTGHDMKMAINAGVKKIAVTYGAHHHTELEKYNPEFTFHSMEDLSGWLKDYYLMK